MHVLLSLALATQIAASDDDLLLKTGDRAPPFAMRDLDRDIFSIRDHTGESPKEAKKAILLVFFATWCEPCMKEIPIIKKVYKRWKGKGRDVEVVYVGLSQGAKELSPFAKKKKLPWRVVPDSFGLLARRYGASKLPHLFIIDKEGKIAFQHRGIAPKLQGSLESQLARITGVAAPAADAEAEAPSVVDTPRFDKSYSLGRAPSSSGSAAAWSPLGTFIGEAVDANVEVQSADSYEAFRAELKAGKYDIVNAGPYLCHEVRDLYEPVVRIERQDSPTYFGLLFTKRKSSIRKLQDLKGKTVAMVSQHSTSGGLFPQLALIEAGLKPGVDVTIQWVGGHSAVAEAVKAGKADAGGCFEDCRDLAWKSPRRKAAATRVLAYTADIPSEMILLKRSLDAKTKKRLATAILGVNKAPGIMQQISQGETTVTALVAATEKDLESVDAAIQKVTGKEAH